MPSKQPIHPSSSLPGERSAAPWWTARKALWLGSACAGALLVAAAAGGWTQQNAAGRQGFLTNFDGGELTTQDGAPFDFASLSGKVTLFNFMFTSCPTVCPTQTRALVQVQRALPPSIRSHVRFVSVSLDPERDTPAALQVFAQRMGVDSTNWTLVTGSRATVERLSERLRLFADRPSTQPDGHGTTLWLMDGQGTLLQRYAGNPPDVERLTHELAQLVELQP